MRKLKSLLRKIRSQSGESIAEVLVSLLIAALAMLLLAGMINASSNLISKSRSKMQEYYEANNAIVQQSSSGTTGSATLTEVDSEGNTVSDGVSQSIDVTYFENDTFTNKPVITYKK